MKVLFAADIHCAPAHLRRLLFVAERLEVALLVIGGDLIPVRGSTLAESIGLHRQWLEDTLLPALREFRRRRPGTRVLLDFGNDDLMAVRPVLEEAAGSGFELLHMRVVEVAPSLAVAGYMNVAPTPFRLKDWERADCADRPGFLALDMKIGARTGSGREEPCRLRLADGTIENDLDRLGRMMDEPRLRGFSFLFVSHCPPLATGLDSLYDGRHVGSLAVRRFIETRAASLAASLHGHIHESPRASGLVCEEIAGVPCFNPGQEHRALQALLFDPADARGTATRLSVSDSGISETRVWRPVAKRAGSGAWTRES